MRDKTLLRITVITDDDTGIHQIGELDFGIPISTNDWLEKTDNRKKLADWLLWLSNQCRDSKSPFEPRMTDQEVRDLSEQLAS
jgi:hypothetical protein